LPLGPDLDSGRIGEAHARQGDDTYRCDADP
jgi:hypothetical protein